MAKVSVKQRNIERLIARCENILSGKTQFQGKEWKLVKYVSALHNQIRELEKYSSVDPELLRSFRQRATVLHEVTRNDKEPSSPLRGHGPLSSGHTPLLAPPPEAPRPSRGGNKLLMRASGRKEASMREQLFSKSVPGEDETDSTNLRHRDVVSLETVLERHEREQGEIAEDMVRLARSLRHTSMAARDIIRKDKEVLENAARQTDENIRGVEHETGRLQEKNRGWFCGIWLLLLLVFIVFIAMVVVIRIVPKPS